MNACGRRNWLEAIPTPVFIVHDPDSLHITGNREAEELLRIPRNDKAVPATYRIMRDGKEIPVDQLPVQQAARGDEVRDCELDLVFTDGTKRTIRGNATPLKGPDGSITGAVSAFIDITKRKQAEEIQRRINVRLKMERHELLSEVDRRKKAEAGLDAKSHALEEVNTALRVLLKQREEDKISLESNIRTNVEELVLPHVAKLKKTRLDAAQESIIGVIEDNLMEITSPIIRTLHTFGFTPTEIEIVSYIKIGKTAKQAAELLGISPRTLEGHRYNIRKKLGLDQKKLNLRSYLLSIP